MLINEDALKVAVKKLEDIDDGRALLTRKRGDVMEVAKAAGLNPRALSKIVAERRAGQSAAGEMSETLKAYRAALGMAG